MLDGCSAHFSDYIQDECTFYNVYLVNEPAGSSDQVQALDLGIFGIQKSIKSTLRSNAEIDSQSDDIRKIYNSLQKSATPDNIVMAFRQAGITCLPYSGGLGTVVNIEHVRAIRDI